MSLKYQRIRQQDENLPWLLKQFTRAFSSITMAIILLVLICLCGILGSVPIGMLGHALLMVIAVAIPMGISLTGSYRMGASRWAMGLLLLILGLAISIMDLYAVSRFVDVMPWFERYHTTVIYRLRYFEMTELELYSWWPMKVVLGLFVLNMIWATLRRIEFKFANLGVLSVHTGIVFLAIGSLFYGHAKREGDTILWRDDQPIAKSVSHFYDATTPAIYMSAGQADLMVPLPQLPRYNDYDPNTHALDIKLHDLPEFQARFGKKLQATIPGFLAYAKLQTAWLNDKLASKNPAWQVQLLAGKDGKPLSQHALIGRVPSKRSLQTDSWSIEYLLAPTKQRLTQITTQTNALHSLLVHIPASGLTQTFPITPGQVIDLPEHGYQITIEQIGPYELPIITDGYRGATDTQATVRIKHAGKNKRRIVMHQFPELSQDFLVSATHPMSGRSKPSADIVLTYLDRSASRFYLIQKDVNKPSLQLLICLPGKEAMLVDFGDDRFPLAVFEEQSLWLQLLRYLPNARQTAIPVPVPKANRLSKEEGTYINALVPVDLHLPMADGSTWQRRVWLSHMRYPDPNIADNESKPIEIDIPTLGKIQLCFSRQRLPLPFEMKLNHFEMVPYPSSNMPRDFYSNLTLTFPDQTRIDGTTRLNHPLVYNRIKISQTGWDPGNPNNPLNNEKDSQGRYKHQQRYVILGIGNNVGIHIVFAGACLIVLGIPGAFYLKPAWVRAQKRKLQTHLKQTQTNKAC